MLYVLSKKNNVRLDVCFYFFKEKKSIWDLARLILKFLNSCVWKDEPYWDRKSFHNLLIIHENRWCNYLIFNHIFLYLQNFIQDQIIKIKESTNLGHCVFSCPLPLQLSICNHSFITDFLFIFVVHFYFIKLSKSRKHKHWIKCFLYFFCNHLNLSIVLFKILS